MSNTIYDRIRAGEFKTNLPYPNRPKEPTLLRQPVKYLSDAELASIPAVRAAFAAEKVAFEEASAAYRRDNSERENAFEVALAEEHGLTNHPLRSKVYSKAYDRGHSGGHAEMASAYDDYADLVQPIK